MLYNNKNLHFLMFIRHHPWITSVVGMSVVVYVFELMLMIRKFGLFNLSFIQPYSIESLQDRMIFFIVSIYSDLLLYGSIGLVFFFLARLSKRSNLNFAYHFFFVVTTVSLTVLIAKYKVLSYMSDTINFTIAKNIAGGSLLSAVGYVADEAVIIVVFLLLAILVHWVGFKLFILMVNRNNQPENKTNENDEENNRKFFSFWRIIRGYMMFLVGFILIVLLTQQYDNVRYGVTKKNSYVLLTGILDSATDFDQDNYGYFSFPEDLAMFNASIYPGAVDIPNNNIDEDMLLGDFKLPSKNYSLDFSKVKPKFDYVFFIIFESARGDLLDKKVNNISVSPNLHKVSQLGTIFPNAYSHTGFTASSLKAIFNGKLTPSNDRKSLFDIAKEVGYEINVFSGQAESFSKISEKTNMRKSANYFFDAETNIKERVYANTSLSSLRLSEETVVNAVNNHLDIASLTPKQFYYINFQAAHFPYHHKGMKNLLNISPIPRGQISNENKDWVEETYWNAVASADDALGELVSHLKKLNIYDKSLLVITGDHGESLFDDGVLGHGHKINDQQLKIPLITNLKVKPITKPIGQTDMREIVLDLMNHDDDLMLTNRKLGNRKAVFHIVGGISSPVQISHTYNDDRIIYDFRTRKVMFASTGSWQQIDDIAKQPQSFKMLRELVSEWEYLNYRKSSELQPSDLHDYQEGKLVHNH